MQKIVKATVQMRQRIAVGLLAAAAACGGAEDGARPDVERVALLTSGPVSGVSLIAAMRSPARATFATPSKPEAGSITRAPLSTQS